MEQRKGLSLLWTVGQTLYIIVTTVFWPIEAAWPWAVREVRDDDADELTLPTDKGLAAFGGFMFLLVFLSTYSAVFGRGDPRLVVALSVVYGFGFVALKASVFAHEMRDCRTTYERIEALLQTAALLGTYVLAPINVFHMFAYTLFDQGPKKEYRHQWSSCLWGMIINPLTALAVTLIVPPIPVPIWVLAAGGIVLWIMCGVILYQIMLERGQIRSAALKNAN